MKTSELLVYVLVFLFGYMLFKRCGCRYVEGGYFDDIMQEYVLDDKSEVHKDIYHVGQFLQHPIDNTLRHPGDVALGAGMVISAGAVAGM
jgi:hypothetical protein